MLTDQEVNRIFAWQPYRGDWPVDRNQVDDNIDFYYGNLINNLTRNQLFDAYCSEDGGLANYLEFICYTKGLTTYEGNAILVCISLCAPIAAYGQTKLFKRVDSIGMGGLFSTDMIGVITDITLTGIEKEIKSILLYNNLALLDKEFASRQLADEIVDAIEHENHNEGSQYLQGIFQKTD